MRKCPSFRQKIAFFPLAERHLTAVFTQLIRRSVRRQTAKKPLYLRRWYANKPQTISADNPPWIRSFWEQSFRYIDARLCMDKNSRIHGGKMCAMMLPSVVMQIFFWNYLFTLKGCPLVQCKHCLFISRVFPFLIIICPLFSSPSFQLVPSQAPLVHIFHCFSSSIH